MIKPGQRARDTVTGFEGIVWARHEYFKSSAMLTLHSKWNEETQAYAENIFSEGQCEFVDNGLLGDEVPLTDLEF